MVCGITQTNAYISIFALLCSDLEEVARWATRLFKGKIMRNLVTEMDEGKQNVTKALPFEDRLEHRAPRKLKLAGIEVYAIPLLTLLDFGAGIPNVM